MAFDLLRVIYRLKVVENRYELFKGFDAGQLLPDDFLDVFEARNLLDKTLDAITPHKFL